MSGEFGSFDIRKMFKTSKGNLLGIAAKLAVGLLVLFIGLNGFARGSHGGRTHFGSYTKSDCTRAKAHNSNKKNGTKKRGC